MNSGRARFGVFEADMVTGELLRQGRKVPLQQQPFLVLALLLERAGEVVTREDLQKAVWPVGHLCRFRLRPQHRDQEDPSGAGRLGGEPPVCRDTAA
jgi:hypothetical protein